MTTSNKAKVQQLASELQRSVAPETKAMKEIIRLLLEDAKNNLCTVQGDDMLRTQGEAQVLLRLQRELTQPSPLANKE